MPTSEPEASAPPANSLSLVPALCEFVPAAESTIKINVTDRFTLMADTSAFLDSSVGTATAKFVHRIVEPA